MIEVLRVHEDLERATVFVFRAFVENHVVDGDVHGVVGDRRLDLVRRADEDIRTLELFVHPDDIGGRVLTQSHNRSGFRLLRFRLAGLFYPELGDFLADDYVAHGQNFP